MSIIIVLEHIHKIELKKLQENKISVNKTSINIKNVVQFILSTLQTSNQQTTLSKPTW